MIESTTSIDMAKLNNHPAFPVNAFAGDDKFPPVRPNSGMAIRDWFAGMAVQGLLAGLMQDTYSPEDVSAKAYEIATAMLNQRDS
jgi:hypothetical protein